MDTDKLIIDNIPLVNLMIKELHCRWTTDDQYQKYYDFGLEGLIKGAKSYDESKGKPSTYLCTCIKNNITRCFYLDNLPKRKNLAGTDISLNYAMYSDNLYDYTELGELIPDPKVNIEEEIEKKIQIETIIAAINSLDNERDKLVIKMYYGLDGYKEANSCDEIAKEFGVSRNMINTRLHRAINKLKKNLKKSKDISIKKEKKKKYGFGKDYLLMNEIITATEVKEQKQKTSTTLNNLNTVLFQQIDKLNDNNSDFEHEIRKAYAISQLAQQIVANTNTQIKAVKLMREKDITDEKELAMLGINK